MANQDRDCNRFVAERVMGWRREVPGISPCWWVDRLDNQVVWACGSEAWSPSSDATADLEVLQHVRETWNDEMKVRFVAALNHMRGSRAPDISWVRFPSLFTEIGDYARAAKMVMEERDG